MRSTCSKSTARTSGRTASTPGSSGPGSPNYNVSVSERVVAADLSEEISTAGKEASGTGNMKMALSGALTVGTLDGANIEIRERVGAENFFPLWAHDHKFIGLTEAGYSPRSFSEGDDELRDAIDALASGAFTAGDRDAFDAIITGLLARDEYLLLADYRSYVDCQERISPVWLEPESWTRMSILNAARCGFFSSDRAVRAYCRDIWRTASVPSPTDRPSGFVVGSRRAAR
jgi:glycogen phosphorylase